MSECHCVGPRLIDLLNQIERVGFDGMKAYRLNFHPPDQVERVTRLCRDPMPGHQLQRVESGLDSDRYPQRS